MPLQRSLVGRRPGFKERVEAGFQPRSSQHFSVGDVQDLAGVRIIEQPLPFFRAEPLRIGQQGKVGCHVIQETRFPVVLEGPRVHLEEQPRVDVCHHPKRLQPARSRGLQVEPAAADAAD